MSNCQKHTTGKEMNVNTYEKRRKKAYYYLPLLLVFVSITSFIAGTRIGRGTDLNLGQMLDTIILSPSGEVVDANRIDFSGQIWNADGSPCGNQMLELHSEPMRTVTDSEGFFYFRSVETGEHRLAMLDEAGQELGAVGVTIGRDKTVSYGNIEKGISGEYQLAVSEQAVVIHIKIRVDSEKQIVLEPEVYTRKSGENYRDSKGQEQSSGQFGPQEPQTHIPESGEGKLDLDNSEAAVSESQNSVNTTDTDAAAQSQPYRESRIPEELTQSQESQQSQQETALQPPEPSESAAATEAETGKQTEGNSGGGGGGSSNTTPTKPSESETETENPTEPTKPEPEPTEPTKPDPTDPTEPDPTEPTDPDETDPGTQSVTVQEKGGPVWTQNTVISLFANRTGAGAERKLMPGSAGYYEFLVSNPNTFGITYRMGMSAPAGQLLLPLRYRLKSGNVYLCGDKDTWLTAGQLSAASVKLNPGEDKEYRLEWQWLFEGGDDAYDTQIGTGDNLEYRVIVTIAIEQTTV